MIDDIAKPKKKVLENNAAFPFPLKQGKRNQKTPPPLIKGCRLDGIPSAATRDTVPLPRVRCTYSLGLLARCHVSCCYLAILPEIQPTFVTSPSIFALQICKCHTRLACYRAHFKKISNRLYSLLHPNRFSLSHTQNFCQLRLGTEYLPLQRPETFSDEPKTQLPKHDIPYPFFPMSVPPHRIVCSVWNGVMGLREGGAGSWLRRCCASFFSFLLVYLGMHGWMDGWITPPSEFFFLTLFCSGNVGREVCLPGDNKLTYLPVGSRCWPVLLSAAQANTHLTQSVNPLRWCCWKVGVIDRTPSSSNSPKIAATERDLRKKENKRQTLPWLRDRTPAQFVSSR